jgi:metallo-beta-lactamase family protein
MHLAFLGGAGTVTGSKFLVTSGDTRLLVDCGLFQGLKNLRLQNRRELPFDPNTLAAVALTHAHLDHSGLLPVLVREGFRGPIYATPATADLAGILLPDSGHIQEEDARYANKNRFSKHKPALPLYNTHDAERVASRFQTVELGEEFRVGDLTLRFQRAGHILGASSVLVSDGRSSLLFSGDLGRDDDLLMNPPERPGSPDWIVCESTYGDRQHSERDPIAALETIVTRTVDRGGVLLIPSFAVGRAQTILYALHKLASQRRSGDVPVYVNSPMATSVTDLYLRYTDDHRLSPGEVADACASARFTRAVEESKELNTKSGPMIIISASGMLTGGRILHHLKRFAPDSRNTILLPGFQAAGTRGDALAHGAKEIKVHGSYVPVRAEVVRLELFSAHADQKDLLTWLAACRRPPKEIYVVHGEPRSSDELRRRIQEQLKVTATVPQQGDSVELT